MSQIPIVRSFVSAEVSLNMQMGCCVSKINSLAAHYFFAFLKEDLHFTIANKALYKADPEIWVFNNGPDSVSHVHVIFFGGNVIHRTSKAIPLFLFDSWCITGSFCHLTNNRGSVAVNSFASITFNIHWLSVDDCENQMIVV